MIDILFLCYFYYCLLEYDDLNHMTRLHVLFVLKADSRVQWPNNFLNVLELF